MAFIRDPNAGPTAKIADGGTLFDDTVAATSPLTLSKTLVCTPGATGVVFRIYCSVNGSYVVKYIDEGGAIRTLRTSAAYTSSATLVEVAISSFVRESFIEFTPSSAPCTLFIDGYAQGPGMTN